jgi:signal peptidase II
MPQRANRFWTIFLTIVLIDVATKRFAVSQLAPPYVPRDIIGDFLRFTLAFNSGGAMSLSLGPSSRWWFTLLSIATLFVLAYMYRQISPDDRLQIASIALICGGAVGNLLDRVRSPRGVVDFIDIGVGAHRFWTFNIADMAVTIGTAMLTWVLCVRASGGERRSHRIPATGAAGALDEPN